MHDLGNDKLKTIRVQMIRADIQQNESFRKTYLVEDPVAGNRSKGKWYLWLKQVFLNSKKLINKFNTLIFVFLKNYNKPFKIHHNWKKLVL